MLTTLSCVEINCTAPAQASVIWLHGLGADGNDFVPIVKELNLSNKVRFVFPHAPLRPVTINQGYVMRAWYDIVSLDINAVRQADQTGILQSVKLIEDLLKKEIDRGIPPEKIIIAGFSQGAAMALIAGLHYGKKLGGIIALSGYLPQIKPYATIHTNHTTPIFIAHGSQDQVVPYQLGELVYRFLIQNNYPVSWHIYPMAHSVCPEEVRDIAGWLQKIIN